MANFTEKAIQEAFIGLLNEKPLDKITVREIAQSCGVNRNTFYYHYHDVYDLLDTILDSEIELLLADVETVTSMHDALKRSLRFALDNKQGIYHVYTSVNRDRLSQFLYETASIGIRRIVEGQREGLDVAPSDIDYIVELYASMIEGAILNGMRQGATRDYEAFIDNAIRLLDGTVRLTLENSVRTNL